uniref:TLC domain-containing protein n=1 Tax=Strongyloides papillosus TaxID=174720 RepID=A0A0N5B646_STREA
MSHNDTLQKNDAQQDRMTNENIQIIVTVISSILFFRLATYIVRWYFFKNLLFKTRNYFESTKKSKEDGTYFAHVQHNKKWRISNECISCFHAFICSIWLFFNIIHYFDTSINNESLYVHSFGLMFMMIFGYIISDSIDMLANERSIRVYVLIFHHTLVAIGCLYPVILKHFGGIVIIGFLMEVNSIFLHIRSLLNYSGYSKARLSFKMLAFINILTFILFRFIPNLYLIYFIIVITNNVPWYETFACCLVSVGLLTTNTVLFYRLLVADNFLTIRKRNPVDFEEQSLLDHNNQLSIPTTPFLTAPTTPETVTIGTQTINS